MTFDAILEQVVTLLKRQGRVSYRALKMRFNLDDEYLDVLKEELIEQVPRSPRRNGLPVKLVDGALLMCHQHPTGALVELRQIGKTSSGTDGVLHHPPETFDGVEVVPTMGG